MNKQKEFRLFVFDNRNQSYIKRGHKAALGRMNSGNALGLGPSSPLKTAAVTMEVIGFGKLFRVSVFG